MGAAAGFFALQFVSFIILLSPSLCAPSGWAGGHDCQGADAQALRDCTAQEGEGVAHTDAVMPPGSAPGDAGTFPDLLK